MGKPRFQITMTLDGYGAGPNQSLANPLGEGGVRLEPIRVPAGPGVAHLEYRVVGPASPPRGNRTPGAVGFITEGRRRSAPRG